VCGSCWGDEQIKMAAIAIVTKAVSMATAAILKKINP
jgi:hypothetical protein